MAGFRCWLSCLRITYQKANLTLSDDSDVTESHAPPHSDKESSDITDNEREEEQQQQQNNDETSETKS